MSRIKQVESYVLSHLDNIDLIIEQVCHLLPSSYFYAPEIRSGAFLMKRNEMKEYKRKLNFPAYQNDSSLNRQMLITSKEYNLMLEELACTKREALRVELLEESLEMQLACCISLIHCYRLLKHMRTFN